MLDAIIRWSIRNRFLVLVMAVFLSVAGLYTLKETPVDAIPDLSDVQVIIKTSFPGQAPQVVEDQVTYPLSTAMLAVPKAVVTQTEKNKMFLRQYLFLKINNKVAPYYS